MLKICSKSAMTNPFLEFSKGNLNYDFDYLRQY